MANDDVQRAWVGRVLGYSFANGSGHGGVAAADLLPIWLEAKEEVDAAITKLQQALQDRNDPDLTQIAEYGLHGVTQGQNVRMLAALREAAGGSPRAQGKLADAVDRYREFLDGSPIVGLFEDNPFDAPVPLRAVLGPALDRIAASLPR